MQHIILLSVLLIVLFFPAIAVVGYGVFFIIAKLFSYAFEGSTKTEIVIDFVEFILSNIAFTVVLIAITGTNVTWTEMSLFERVQTFGLFIGTYLATKMVARLRRISSEMKKEKETP